MKILGIETSCDETGAGVVETTGNGKITLLANSVVSSLDQHIAYGGVVPEIAARSHIEHINPVIQSALKTAKVSLKEIDAIAVTHGPGLGGSLLVGVITARTIALIHKKPLYKVNHVEAHVSAAFINSLSPGLANDYSLPASQPQFPLIALIASGGHTQLVLFENSSSYLLLGQTQDDAVGEAFDKVARIIGLPYPGGPSIERAAASGDPTKYPLPIARLENPYDFSFSGLKTAVLRTAQQIVGKDYTFPSHQIAERLSDTQRSDLAASFQVAALKALVAKVKAAATHYHATSVVVSGGVAASLALRNLLQQSLSLPVISPDISLCTDNGAMVAANGALLAHSNQAPVDPLTLEIAPNLKMQFHVKEGATAGLRSYRGDIMSF